MNGTTRLWALGCGVATIALLAGGWFLGVQPQVAVAETTSQNVLTVMAQNQATRIKLAELTKAAAKVDEMTAQNEVLLKAVPTVLKPNTFVRRINEVAALNDVTVTSIVLADSAPYAAPGAAADASASPAPVLAATDPAITAAVFTSVPATVGVTGTEDAVLQFAHDIQNDQRVFAISNVQTTSDEGGDVTATFSGYIYTLKR